MNINLGEGIDVNAQTLMTGRGCVIGQSGSGKSYLVGVIVEELSKAKLPFMIVDTEGEYRSLKSAFNVLWVGNEKDADVRIDVDLKKLFAESIANNLPIIFDVSEVMDKQASVYSALSALYEVEEEKKKPFLVVIEEADKFAPQIVHPSANPVEEISVRGRKRGIGLLVATQRPANVSKNVLAQCGYGFIGKLSIENDLQAVSVLFEDRKKLNSLPMLATGTFMTFGLPFKNAIEVKKRLVEHVGGTPKIEEIREQSVKVDSVIRELKSSREGYEGEAVAAEETPKRSTPAKFMNIDVIKGSFGVDKATEYASRLTKKKFVVFGSSVERVDSIKQKFMQVTLFSLRVPSGSKNEFSEYYAIVKGNELVDFRKKLKFTRTHIEKPAKLSPDDIAVATLLARRGKANFDFLIKRSGIKEERLMKALSHLKRVKIVSEEKDTYLIKDYRKALLKEMPQTEKLRVDQGTVMNFDAKMSKTSTELMSNLLPGTQVMSATDVFIPVDEITLRRGNRVRLFLLDGLYGGRLQA
ncbi:MAG: DUF87 domain-containing protein [Candidatus Micrarchaeales archaeon]|nr:DUF87 domain-containing protein [Candidatus Micrarchaeales archaeon]